MSSNFVGKLNAPALTSMREIAFGKAAKVHIHNVVSRSEAMRNDEELLAKAEAKRLRKLGRNKSDMQLESEET